jgi:hypothetical protein
MKSTRYFGNCRALVLLLAVALVGTLSAAPTKIATGPDTGAPPQINLYSPAGVSTGTFLAETASFTGGIRVAMGDITSTNDVITGTGPGAASVVKVFRGKTGEGVFSFLPFGPNFTLGVYVAAGDVNGDGIADIIVGSDQGGGPHVKVFSGANGTTVLQDFAPFGPAFQGGVRVAAGDLNGDGLADIICGTGPGSAEVVAFSGRDLTMLKGFTAYAGFGGGVYVAAGDVNGDGIDDIITGAGDTSTNVKVFNGLNNTVIYDFLALRTSTKGVRVAAGDLNGDGRPDIIASTGPGDPSRLLAFDAATLNTIVDISPYGSSTAGVFAAAIPRFPPQSLNISTRANVLTGDNIVIGGFIVNGTDLKDVLIRGIGPSSGVPGALADPTLELYTGSRLVAFNNNWKDTQQTQIQATGIPPGNDLESAIVQSLPPGSYTAVLRGNNGGQGIGLVEVYDLNASTTDSQLANISTRSFVQNGNSVMIAGVILGGGTGGNRVLVRALGPSLSQFGVSNPLPDPTLGLYNAQGTLTKANNDWKESQQGDIQATGLAPTNDLESAVLAILPSGNYTAIVGGTGGVIGVGLVEVYNLQ